MAFIPYSRQSISEDDIASVVRVLRSDFLTQGPEIERFEQAIAAVTGAKHAIAVSSATAALHLACLALDVGAGDTVWTVPLTFAASANCARYCGAAIDFVDIDPHSRNIDPALLREKLADAAAAGTLPKAIIPVDFAGLPCPMPEIVATARVYGVKLIEDASHALGASIEGVPVGAGGADITVLSFHAVKIITSGEGGMCLTNDDALATRLRHLRTHGITRDPTFMEKRDEALFYYEQLELGFNYRMTDIHAALGTSQLARLEARQVERERLSQRYDRLIDPQQFRLPPRINGYVSAHHLYAVEIKDDTIDRDKLFAHMRAAGIGANVHYIPVHLQPYYARQGFVPGQFPASERYYARALTIPLFPEMTDDQQDQVIAALMSGLHSN